MQEPCHDRKMEYVAAIQTVATELSEIPGRRQGGNFDTIAEIRYTEDTLGW
jgi:hypothetical protein